MQEVKAKDVDKEEEKTQLWKYVTLEDYRIPPKPLQEKVKTGLANIINQILPSKTIEEFQPFDDLTSFSPSQLERIVPEPDWYQGIKSIDKTITEFKEDNLNPNSVLLFIEKPFSGSEEIIRAWANENEIEILEPPSYEAILQDTTAIANEVEETLQDRMIVIPDLQRYFLRHQEGLQLIRDLNDIFSRYDGEEPIVVGCESYAWNFLTKILHFDLSNIEIRIQQTLDADDLQKWLLELTDLTRKRRLLYRQGSNGGFIFEKQAKEFEENTDQPVNVHYRYLQNLASYSLGLPEVIRHIWMYSLRITPEDESHLENEEEESTHAHTIWVMPWKKILLPELPNHYTRSQLFVLHALLLHSGLRLKWLDDLNPLTTGEIYGILQELLKLGMVKVTKDGKYSVNEIAYPGLRKILKKEGFLIDEME